MSLMGFWHAVNGNDANVSCSNAFLRFVLRFVRKHSNFEHWHQETIFFNWNQITQIRMKLRAFGKIRCEFIEKLIQSILMCMNALTLYITNAATDCPNWMVFSHFSLQFFCWCAFDSNTHLSAFKLVTSKCPLWTASWFGENHQKKTLFFRLCLVM